MGEPATSRILVDDEGPGTFIALLLGCGLALAGATARCGDRDCGRELLRALGICLLLCVVFFPYRFYADYDAGTRMVVLYRRVFGLRWVWRRRAAQGAFWVFLDPEVDGGPMVSLHLGQDAGAGSLLLATQPKRFAGFEAAARALAAATGLPAWREGYAVTDGTCVPAAGIRERLAPPASDGAPGTGPSAT
ncbi:hypothetical protein [Plastoroseomonas hellenica]|uniref:hypothetical protein n=1 Tax=Plastoroseomonas hellenica TaxID=2687306 RepID=UPI001BA5B441|nr:hypothetical protein [Plastoroseomonas hellenica]MBR0641283.1 hypothetical protein [Plastoroseomonas hellenica]